MYTNMYMYMCKNITKQLTNASDTNLRLYPCVAPDSADPAPRASATRRCFAAASAAVTAMMTMTTATLMTSRCGR